MELCLLKPKLGSQFHIHWHYAISFDAGGPLSPSCLYFQAAAATQVLWMNIFRQSLDNLRAAEELAVRQAEEEPAFVEPAFVEAEEEAAEAAEGAEAAAVPEQDVGVQEQAVQAEAPPRRMTTPTAEAYNCMAVSWDESRLDADELCLDWCTFFFLCATLFFRFFRLPLP